MTVRRIRSAFTLLELLLAMALMGILLAAVWGMTELYTSSFERGEAGIEEGQIVRAVAQLLTDDLQAAIQDPGNKYIKPDKGPAQVGRFGLSGTATSLRIDVLQINPFDPTAAETKSTGGAGAIASPLAGMPSSGLSSDDQGHQAPELKTVFYTFVDPRSSSDYAAVNKPGLTRRESDFETPPETSESTTSMGSSVLASQLPFNPTAVPGQEATVAAPTIFEIMASNPDDAEVWAPEIVGLRFRYFDGNGWRGAWNSLNGKGLPVAVEATLEIADLGAAEELRQGKLTGETPSIETTTRRVVVFLPGSPLKKPTPKPATTRPPQPRPAAPVMPTPPRPRPTQPTTPSEGWIRTNL